MSYTPEDQMLADRIDRLIIEIDAVDSAMDARIMDDSSWKEEHLDELTQFRLEFVTLKRRLIKLKKHNK